MTKVRGCNHNNTAARTTPTTQATRQQKQRKRQQEQQRQKDNEDRNKNEKGNNDNANNKKNSHYNQQGQQLSHCFRTALGATSAGITPLRIIVVLRFFPRSCMTSRG